MEFGGQVGDTPKCPQKGHPKFCHRVPSPSGRLSQHKTVTDCCLMWPEEGDISWAPGDNQVQALVSPAHEARCFSRQPGSPYQLLPSNPFLKGETQLGHPPAGQPPPPGARDESSSQAVLHHDPQSPRPAPAGEQHVKWLLPRKMNPTRTLTRESYSSDNYPENTFSDN